MKEEYRNKWSGFKIAIIVIIVIVLLLFIKGFTIIETGNVGVKSFLGKISTEELKPGVNWAMPFIAKIEPVFTKTILINYSGTQNKKADTVEMKYEKTLLGEDVNGLDLGLDLTVEVAPVDDMMANMYIEVGRSGFDKKVLQTIRSVAREVMSSFKAEEIMQKRAEIQAMMRKKLQEENSNKYYAFTNIQLKKIYLPEKVKKAIENVQLAKQKAKTAHEQIKQNTAIAKSAIEKAKGEAISMKTRAQGEADSRIIRANAEATAIKVKAAAQAKANLLLSKSLSPILIKSQSIQAWKSGGSQVPAVANSIPFIGNIKDFSSK